MKGILERWAFGLVAAVLVLTVGAASAQGLWYKEVEKDGRIYVFNTSKKYDAWKKSGDMGVAITLVGHGPNGETVVGENETAIDLYNLKHDRPGYDRPAPPPPSAPGPPTLLRWGSEGELKFGLLLQAWYIMDDSPLAVPTGTTTNSTLGNFIGANTFRLRRSEIKLNGKVNSSWAFEVMFDPAKAIVSNAAASNNNTSDAKILQDLAITYTGLKGWELSLGQKKITLTEEGVRSSSELDFPERAQIIRAISDRRETGFFFKGDVIEPVTVWGSVTNATASNTLDDSNDTVRVCGRVDLKLLPGLNAGASGCNNGGDGITHLGQKRVGGHARYNGGASLPLIVEGEYYYADDQRPTGQPSLRRDGFYGAVLYTVANVVQLGVRYDEITNDKDAQNGENGVTQKNSKIKTWTIGVHWLPLGHEKYKNVSLKADWFKVKQDNRTIPGVNCSSVDCQSYNEFLIAAQVAF